MHVLFTITYYGDNIFRKVPACTLYHDYYRDKSSEFALVILIRITNMDCYGDIIIALSFVMFILYFLSSDA